MNRKQQKHSRCITDGTICFTELEARTWEQCVYDLLAIIREAHGLDASEIQGMVADKFLPALESVERYREQKRVHGA